MSKQPPQITQIAQFRRIQNYMGWRMLSQASTSYEAGMATLANHLAQYAWNLIENMEKKITLDRFYELLQDQEAVFLETHRSDARYILKKVLLTKRKTYPYPMYKIEIGSSIETLAAIFPPSNLLYKK